MDLQLFLHPPSEYLFLDNISSCFALASSFFFTWEIALFNLLTTSSKRPIFSSATLNQFLSRFRPVTRPVFLSRFPISPSSNKTYCTEFLNSCNFFIPHAVTLIPHATNISQSHSFYFSLLIVRFPFQQVQVV